MKITVEGHKGTGKTTIANCIIRLLKVIGCTITLTTKGEDKDTISFIYPRPPYPVHPTQKLSIKWTEGA